jgi:uncharacterized membrane protein HdeD (DUF308 family)
MLSFMRRGLLEKSWRYLCWGVVLASVGVVVLVSTVAFPDGSIRYLITNYFGVALATTGAMSFVLGFRSHTGVFHPKGFSVTKNGENIPVENRNLNS